MSRLRLAGLVLVLAVVLLFAGSMVWQWVGGRGAGATRRVVGPTERVRVQVLNAARIPGLARTATERLRDAGYDVLEFGNAARASPDSSMVIDRVGKPETARQVAGVLAIPRVVSRPDTTLYLEVTVVLGKDWAGIPKAAPRIAPADTLRR
jgi:hypothetical protein